MASLRDVEKYLDEEIESIAKPVVERVRSANLCGDGCWEGLVLLGREEQERLRREEHEKRGWEEHERREWEDHERWGGARGFW